MQCMLHVWCINRVKIIGACRLRFFGDYSIYRCSMMTVVQISLMSSFEDLIFWFTQMHPLTLAVCVNNIIFFLISTWKSIIYALLYTCISATLNERIFSGGGLWMKKTNPCSCNNSSDFHYILHHRHLRAKIMEPSVTYWGIQPCLRVINIYIWDRSFTLRQLTVWKDRFCFSCVYFGLTSKPFQQSYL